MHKMCISYCIRFLQSTAEDLYSTGFQTWSFHALSGLRGLMINAELGRTRPNLLHIQILDPLERWPDSVKLSWSYIPLLSSDTLCIWTQFQNLTSLSCQLSQLFRSVNSAVSGTFQQFPLTRLRGSSNEVSAGAPNCSRRHRNAACSKFPPTGRHAPATSPIRSIRLPYERKIKWNAVGHIPHSVFRMWDVHWCLLMCTV